MKSSNPQIQLEEIIKGFAEVRATLEKMTQEQLKEQKRLKKEREEEQKRLKKEREEEQKRLKKELLAKEKEEDKKRRKEKEEYDTRMRKLEELVGSSQNNMADVAEEAFYQNLKERKKLGSVTFDSVGRNLRDFKGNEYDLVLENGKYVGIVEVKQKLHPNDVEKFVTKKIPTFKSQFTQVQGKQIIGAIGGMAVVPDARKKAENYGLFVLSQSGENIKQLNTKNFVPKTY